MDNVIFNATDDLLNEPIVDGQILFSTNGDGRMAIDKEETRYDLGGVIRTDTTIDKNSSKAIQSRAVANAIVNNMQDIETTTEGNYIAGALALKQLKNDLEEMEKTLKANFQNGVDSIYNACVVSGATPKSKTVTDIVNAIGKISQVYYLGEGTSFNIKSVFPNDYQKLTKDNFIVCAKSISSSTNVKSAGGGASGTGSSKSANIVVSYDNNTGVVSVGNNSISDSVQEGGASASSRSVVSVAIYLVTNGIAPLINKDKKFTINCQIVYNSQQVYNDVLLTFGNGKNVRLINGQTTSHSLSSLGIDTLLGL